jgi:hypothetical protein
MSIYVKPKQFYGMSYFKVRHSKLATKLSMCSTITFNGYL